MSDRDLIMARKPTYETPCRRVWDNPDGTETIELASRLEMRAIALGSADAPIAGLMEALDARLSELSDEPATVKDAEIWTDDVPVYGTDGAQVGKGRLIVATALFWPKADD